MAFISDLFQNTIIDKHYDKVDIMLRFTGRTVCLLFSAYWCPPCQQLMPILREFYHDYSKKKKFEIIFISFDENKEAFKKNFADMPWYAVDYDTKEKIKELCDGYEVDSLPKLIILNGETGSIYTLNGRSKIEDEDMVANDFPWPDLPEQE